MAVGPARGAQPGIVKLRSATEADIEAIHLVHVTTMRRLQQTHPQNGQHGSDGVEAYIAGRSGGDVAGEMRQQQFIVMEEAGKVLGFGALHLPKTEVSMLFVDPGHQRRGIGRALLNELESIAVREGVETVSLQATGTAIEFYLKNGFQSDPPVERGAQWALMKKKVC